MRWFLILLCTVASVNTAENFGSSYLTTRENKRFPGKVVKTIDSSSLISCSQACLRHSWCTSTNFKESFGKSINGNCELNKHEFSPINDVTKLTDQPGTTFTMFLKGCLMAGCLNGGSCLFDEENKTFACSCKAPWRGETCQLECHLDVAFLIDSSGSVNSEGFNQEKDFVKKAAKELRVAPGKSRAAVIQFADRASEKIGFNQTATLAAFESAVDALEYATEGSGTRIDYGLRKASQVFTNIRSGDRIKLLLVLTDGQQSGVDATLAQLSSELHDNSVRVLAVGIGSGIHKEQRRLIAGDEANVVIASDFTQLNSKLSALVKKACVTKAATT